MKNFYLIGLFFFSVCLGSAYAAEDEMAVIVSPENKIDQMSSEEIKTIYLKEKKEWGDGVPVTPLDLEESHPGREWFARKIMKRTLASLKFFWIQQIFSGRGTPPMVLTSEEKVKEYVKTHKGAIGYIHSKSLDETVKPIRIEGSNGKTVQ